MSNFYVDCLPLTFSKYRGVDRAWDYDVLLKKRTHHEREKLLSIVLELDRISMDIDDVKKLNKMLAVRDQFLANAINCEVVVSSDEPIKQLDSFHLTFMGFDITNQFGESLLLESDNYPSNENGLVESSQVQHIIDQWHGDNDHHWKKEYIYIVM